MLTQIALNRNIGDGRHAEIIDVAEVLARGDYGSAANAIIAMVRQSPLYQETVARLKAEAQAAATET